jgi:hypothetical protein
MKALLAACMACGILLQGARCQTARQKMDFETYNPPSTLVVQEHKLTRARYPFIDVHNHQWNMPTQNIRELVSQMDKLNMALW